MQGSAKEWSYAELNVPPSRLGRTTWCQLCSRSLHCKVNSFTKSSLLVTFQKASRQRYERRRALSQEGKDGGVNRGHEGEGGAQEADEEAVLLQVMENILQQRLSQI